MKFLTLLLSLLFASNLYAEMQTSFCNAIDGGTLSVQFDEAKQIVMVNKIPQTKVSTPAGPGPGRAKRRARAALDRSRFEE